MITYSIPLITDLSIISHSSRLTYSPAFSSPRLASPRLVSVGCSRYNDDYKASISRFSFSRLSLASVPVPKVARSARYSAPPQPRN